MTTRTLDPVDEAHALLDDLIHAWGSWGPSMTPDASRVAFISDRRGVPELWVQDVAATDPQPEPVLVKLSDDPVIKVGWSADGAWLSCAVATDGGVRTQVWVVRPDGTDARRVAGSRAVHAEMGPWTRSGHRVVVSIPGAAGKPTCAFLVDPATGEREPLAVGDLIHVLDVSVAERLMVVEDGRRGHEFCVVVDLERDEHHPLLPYPAKGATEVALLRPAPLDDPATEVAYLATDAGLKRRQLVAVPLGPAGYRGAAGVLARRDDAELEAVDADDAGRLLLLVWNVAGRSEIELLDTAEDRRIPVHDLPGQVVYTPVLSRDGSCVIMALEGPTRPRELWRLETSTLTWARITGIPELPERALVEPTLETYTAYDGLTLTGWLYRAAGVPGGTDGSPGAGGSGDGEPGPLLVHFHGGPEGQERPTFSPQHQVLAAAGITVFAPNIRGSSGFGRSFVHADDVHGRRLAFDDAIRSAEFLVERGVADPKRLAITGRSYGGYLTLASMAFSPHVFVAGVDICGMSDLLTFYRDTEPWIGEAAVTKYGHPVHDREFLEGISPLRYAANILAPLLVIHGEHDTNVPIGEAHQIVAALRDLGREVEYLELPGEGHEYRKATSRRLLIATMLQFLAGPLRIRPE